MSMSDTTTSHSPRGVKLEAHGLSKRYGTRDVLRNTHLKIEPG